MTSTHGEAPDASEAQAPSEPGPQEQAQALLELIRTLAAELHPNARAALHVTLTSSLDRELGFDSLTRIELLARIEQAFGVGLPEQVLAEADSPQDLLRALAHARRPAAARARVAGTEALRLEALEGVESAPLRAGTLLDVLAWHVAAHPDRTHVLFYGEEEQPEELTYGGLSQGVERIAAGLVARGLEPGQTVAIMLPTCLDYFYTFFGVLMAGGVPVPIYPPARPSQIEDHLRRHAGILANAQVRLLVSVPEAQIASRLLKMQVETLQHVLTAAELSAAAAQFTPPPVAAEDIAHLQYTSGSTGNPKGVVLTHANLLANIRTMGEVLQADSTDVFVSWLPLYHDMGLIGAWLGSLYFACPLVLMSPLSFLAHPESWLWMIHQHRGTLSGGPNFAFELCLRRISDTQREGLDLSSWRVAFNGAEPVIPETLRRFQQRFAPYGLRGEAIAPVYGLAESSVGLAFPPLNRGMLIDRVQREPLTVGGQALPAGPDDASALEFVACGQPLPGHEIRIVNEADQELGEREEGRLQFKGPSVTSGYYRNPQETRRITDGEWVDSGDQAYVAAGDIYLTGRRKDIIIRAGRNVYPHELEEAIGNLPGVRKGCVAVFGSIDPASGTERLVALAETRETAPAALEALQRTIEAKAVDVLGMPLDDIVLAPPHSVPKTSSGKIRRASSREIYERRAVGTRTRAVWLQVLRLWLAGLVPLWRRYRRLAADYLYGGYCWAVLGLIAPPVWMLVVLLPRSAWNWGVVGAAGRLLFRLVSIPVTARGLEHMPVGEPCVVVANHTSYLDGLVLAAVLRRDWTFVAKRELAGNFISRLFLRRLGTQFVERFDKQRGVDDARRVAKVAGQGHTLAFFPEGTFRRTPGLLPFHLGAFQAAAEAGVPVVPIILRGNRSILRDGHWLPRRGRISLVVAPPLQPEGSGWGAALQLRDRTREEMLRLCGEPDLAQHPVVL